MDDLRIEGEAGDYDFKDITSEEFRVYRFPSGVVVKITNPQRIHVSASGGARILDGQGVSHYVPTGWVHLFWKVREDAPHFVF